jgi:hypothetical protein
MKNALSMVTSSMFFPGAAARGLNFPFPPTRASFPDWPGPEGVRCRPLAVAFFLFAPEAYFAVQQFLAGDGGSLGRGPAAAFQAQPGAFPPPRLFRR